MRSIGLRKKGLLEKGRIGETTSVGREARGDFPLEYLNGKIDGRAKAKQGEEAESFEI